jgi:hypothetical protein
MNSGKTYFSLHVHPFTAKTSQHSVLAGWKAENSHETTDALMSLVPYGDALVKRFFAAFVFILNA